MGIQQCTVGMTAKRECRLRVYSKPIDWNVLNNLREKS